jgi:ferric-dicitrate binding protein FerR (iron transport regulator)
MGAVALVCTLRTPANVRTITTSQGEAAFQDYHRDGQPPLVVQAFNGVVTVVAD